MSVVCALTCTFAASGAHAGDADAPSRPTEPAPAASPAPASAPTSTEPVPIGSPAPASALPSAEPPSASPAPAPAAAPTESGASAPPRACPTCPSCCQVVVDVAPQMGISINGDQWLFGGQLRTGLPCLGNLGFGPAFAVGVGGNHLTLRSSWRLDYLVWFDDAHVFGMYPAVGASAFFYGSVGDFASFCNRTQLDECSGYDFGAEVGGGLRYRWLGVDAFLGFGGLPVMSIMAAVSFPLVRPEGS